MRIRRRVGAAFVAAIGLLLLPGVLAVAADDAAVRDAIESRLLKEGLNETAQVSVDVRDGAVTLTGVAPNLPVKRSAEKLARKEASAVHNQIRVQPPEPVADKAIIEGVRKAVLTYPFYTVFDYVEFSVNDGAVVLQGSMLHPWRKTAIESRVAQVAGVRAIQNDLAVQSFTSFDSNLRTSLARRIYGDARFAQYSHRANPPIRILVDKGNVVLAGWVNSNVDKAVLGTIARSTLSFNVENRLQVDTDVPQEDRKSESETS